MKQREISNMYFDKNFPELRKQIEEAIKTTLVITNKKSIDLAVKKVVDIIDPRLMAQYSKGYEEGEYDALNK
mgnify:FL=1